MSLAATYPYYLANAPEAPNHDLEVLDKFSGEDKTTSAPEGSTPENRP